LSFVSLDIFQKYFTLHHVPKSKLGSISASGPFTITQQHQCSEITTESYTSIYEKNSSTVAFV